MNAQTHFNSIRSAENALTNAHETLLQRKNYAAHLCGIAIGEIVPAKTSAGGIECQMAVSQIEVCLCTAHLTFWLSGHKIKKDGSTGSVDCYAVCTLSLDEEAI